MKYILKNKISIDRLCCTHPRVKNIYEFGGLAAIPTNIEPIRVLCLILDNNEVKKFTDNGDGQAIIDAEAFLSTISPKNECIDFLNFVIDNFTNDESRLPISGNRLLGGNTIFINGQEFPISILYDKYQENLNK